MCASTGSGYVALNSHTPYCSQELAGALAVRAPLKYPTSRCEPAPALGCAASPAGCGACGAKCSVMPPGLLVELTRRATQVAAAAAAPASASPCVASALRCCAPNDGPAVDAEQRSRVSRAPPARRGPWARPLVRPGPKPPSGAAGIVAAETGELDAAEAATAAPLPQTDAEGPLPAWAPGEAAAGQGAVGLVLRDASSGDVLAVAALSVPLPTPDWECCRDVDTRPGAGASAARACATYGHCPAA